MAYSKKTWTCPTDKLSAANLNHMEIGVDDAHGEGEIDQLIVNDGAGKYLRLSRNYDYEVEALGTAKRFIVFDKTNRRPVGCDLDGQDRFLIGYVSSDDIAIEANKDWNARKITNLGDPTEPSDIATQAYVDAALSSLSGHAIMIWTGAKGSIPSGWVACDGAGDPLNLEDKFVKAGASTTTGGSTSATSDPHTHSINVFHYQEWPDQGTGYDGIEATTATISDVKPPYYTVIFITPA